jgi:hypothetical protein
LREKTGCKQVLSLEMENLPLPLPVQCHSIWYVHLLSSKDESLLDGRDTLLLLDTLLYPRDLPSLPTVSTSINVASSVRSFEIEEDYKSLVIFGDVSHSPGCVYRSIDRLPQVLRRELGGRSYLVVRLNIQLDLFSGEGADSAKDKSVTVFGFVGADVYVYCSCFKLKSNSSRLAGCASHLKSWKCGEDKNATHLINMLTGV